MVTTEAPVDIQTANLRRAALYFRAINHKLRQRMLHLLNTEGRMTVTKLYEKLKLEQSVASQHLAILRKANLVITERDGKFKFYAVNYQQIKQSHQIANTLLKTNDSLYQ